MYGIMSAPVGDFASSESYKAGFAKKGYGIGADLLMVTDKNVDVAGTVHYFSNAIDGLAVIRTGEFPVGFSMESDPFTTLTLLVGAKVRFPVMEQVTPYIMGQVGLMIGRFPGYIISDHIESFVATSSTGTAMAFSLSAGVRVFQSYDISVRYISGRPEYSSDISYTFFNGKIVWEGHQPTSVVLVTLGYTI